MVSKKSTHPSNTLASSLGSYATAMMLEDGAKNLMLGGQKEIITPMYWVLAKKPVNGKPKV